MSGQFLLKINQASTTRCYYRFSFGLCVVLVVVVVVVVCFFCLYFLGL